MRAYLPATSTMLRELLETGSIGAAPLIAFAVTPGLREWYLDEDVEELEYAATILAARASLRLLDLDAGAARRRVVVAFDAADSDCELRDDLDRGVVRIGRPVALADIASIHIDDADAEAAVAAASDVVLEADLGSEAAQDAVDDAEGFELSWYASQELAALLASL